MTLTGAAEIMRVSWKTAETSQTVASLRSFPMRPAIGWAQPASSTLIGWFIVVRPTCWWNVKNTTDVMFVKVWCLDIILMFLRRFLRSWLIFCLSLRFRAEWQKIFTKHFMLTPGVLQNNSNRSLLWTRGPFHEAGSVKLWVCSPWNEGDSEFLHFIKGGKSNLRKRRNSSPFHKDR